MKNMKIGKIALMAAGTLCLHCGMNMKIVFAESKNDSLASFSEDAVVVGKWGGYVNFLGVNWEAWA
jgi:hypothetical protein